MTPSAAEDLHRRAVVAGNEARFDDARALLAEAVGQTEDPDLLARIDLTRAYLEGETGDPGAAVQICRDTIDRDGLAATTRGKAYSQLGLLQMRTGDHPAALAAFDEAASRLADEPGPLGLVHLNRGNIHLQTGDARAAASDLTCAAEQSLLAGETVQEAKARHNLGYAMLLMGDLVAALAAMEQAAPILAPLSPVSRAVGSQDRAEVLLAAGRPTEAADALRDAAEAYGAEGLRRFQAECELVLARTLLATSPAEATAVARHAAKSFAAHDSETWALRAEAVALMGEVLAGTRTPALLRRTDAVAASLRAAGHRHDAALLALQAVRLAVRLGDLDSAVARIARVRTTADSSITARLLTREVRAEIAEAQHRPGQVRASAKRGLGELHSWQATFGSLDLQSTAVGHGQHLARLGLRAAMADGRAEVLFEWSERARALASRVTSLRPPPDPGLAADLTELRLSGGGEPAAPRALRERIRSHSWFAAAGTVAEPVTLDVLQARLARDDAALVAHLVLDGEITALAVTCDSTAVVPLGDVASVRALLDRVAADLDFAAQNRTDGIADAVRRSLRADLGLLAERLVRPVLGTIGYRRLVLTPSAALAGTPWTCLPGLIGRPLTVPTSASRWFEQTDRPAPEVRAAGFVAGPRLARAEQEARTAAQAWPDAQVLLGDAADAAQVHRLAGTVDLLHVAGHGRHQGDHPLFSAIELADGPWFGHDIDLLPRTPALVVLSACDLGRQTVLHGEESVGMSAAWLYAGARAVISSPTLLDDQLACDVLSSWHRQVATGSPPADALARVTAETDEIVPLLIFGAGW